MRAIDVANAILALPKEQQELDFCFIDKERDLLIEIEKIAQVDSFYETYDDTFSGSHIGAFADKDDMEVINL